MQENSSFRALDAETLERLREIAGADGVLSDAVSLERYGRDETEDLFFPPEVVVLPRDTGQVSGVLALAHDLHLPVTPRGAGTGLSGGALPVLGGVVLSLERMDRIREIDVENLVAEAEAGVITGELQRRVEELGLCYPPDPASRASCLIGGNIAEDSAGPRCCKYGSTRRWVMGLEAVLADGRVMRTGRRTRKDVAGYDLTQLLIGSEGTLAVVTAATLQLIPLPRARLTLALPFDHLRHAAQAVCEIFRHGHTPAACELLEAAALKAVAQVASVPGQLADRQALVLLELDGDDAEDLFTEAAHMAELLEASGARDVLVASEPAEQRQLWEIRETVAEAIRQRSVYKEADTVVPRSALADLVDLARRVATRQGIEAICYGHAGDGNLHVNLLQGDLDDDNWVRARDAAEEELFRGVVALGGSVTGEHGVGWTQRVYLPLAVEAPALEVMRGIKRLLDPRGILNPGKIFPEVE